MEDKVFVHGADDTNYWQNGRGFVLKFDGKNEDMGQFEIVSSEDAPVSGQNVVFISNTTVPYG